MNKPPFIKDDNWTPEVGISGAEGFAKARQMNRTDVKQEKIPSRFFLKKAGPGVKPEDTQAELIVLSAMPYFHFEHTLQDPSTGRYTVHEVCPREFAYGCPLCAKEESYFALLLVCMEIKPYTYTDSFGNQKTSEFRQKTLCIKGTKDQSFFEEVLNKAGTLRGLNVQMTRDAETKAAVGRPTFKAMLQESDIVSLFGPDKSVASYDFARNAVKPSVQELIKKYGGQEVPGSETSDYIGFDKPRDLPINSGDDIIW